ncbi:hypothetical protein A4X06_0g7426 [Tilletia controversa]|uniref:Uncharacterized protein n=1 Tax=Tilletia controversa TaxID=13291 RepID=A0A8X7MM25_9BASI|nr:hypothetical protein CF328_g8378 [Tilletia controversa]KAE8186438.1 hypothetical protein CF336_g6989 [Tilletia laevis]KAE8241713.1 hypothetical protein A4X06_0g7426 [Tilletia controversa]
MLRLPRTGVRLVDLRAEVGIWEPTWRKIFLQFDIRSPTTAAVPVARTLAPTSRPVCVPAPTAPVPSASTPTPSRLLGLAATYDVARHPGGRGREAQVLSSLGQPADRVEPPVCSL